MKKKEKPYWEQETEKIHGKRPYITRKISDKEATELIREWFLNKYKEEDGTSEIQD